MDPDYSDPKTVDFALEEWGNVFKRLPRIDAIFVPGGDPGHTEPKYLMALLEKQAVNLRRYWSEARRSGFPRRASTRPGSMNSSDFSTHSPPGSPVLSSARRCAAASPTFASGSPGAIPSASIPTSRTACTPSFRCLHGIYAFATLEGRESINPRPVDEACHLPPLHCLIPPAS